MEQAKPLPPKKEAEAASLPQEKQEKKQQRQEKRTEKQAQKQERQEEKQSQRRQKMASYQKKMDVVYEKHHQRLTQIKNLVLILLGNALVAYSFVGFVRANGFLSGGAYGLAGILNHFVPAIGFALAVFLFNLPALIIGWRGLDKGFVAKTTICILLQILCLNLFDGIVIYQGDSLLASIFAGVLMGLGDGLVLRSGSGSNGIHLVAMVLKKNLGFSVSTIATAMNVAIIALSASIFGLEKGLYTLILIFVSGRALNFVLDGISRKRTALIVTTKGEEVGKQLMDFLNRGVTMMPATGLYSGQEMEVLMCVVNMLEVEQLKRIVRSLDRNAFITIHETAEVSGRFMKNNAIVDKDGYFQP